jgi:hypothetical protein
LKVTPADFCGRQKISEHEDKIDIMEKTDGYIEKRMKNFEYARTL